MTSQPKMPSCREMRSREIRHAIAAAAFLLVAGSATTARATAAPAGDRPEIRWTQDCRVDAATSRVCLRQAGTDAPDIQQFHTVMVKAPGLPEERHMVVQRPADGWILLARTSAEQVCFDRRTTNAFCGELGIPFTTRDCDSSTFVAASNCELRVVPFDNPVFPDFPDPTSFRTYFWPPAVYQKRGDTAGDVDGLFLNLALGFPNDGDHVSRPAQRQLDVYAWQWFVHLNWPTNKFARTDLTWNDRSVCPVWARWKGTADVMVPAGEHPAPWNAPDAQGRDACSEPSRLTLASATPEAPPRLGPVDTTQADGGILWDRNGSPILYEIRINRRLFDDIAAYSLHTDGGLRRHLGWPDRDDELSLSIGRYFWAGGEKLALRGIAKAPPEVAEGAIAIKLAWKVLTRDEWAAEQTAPRFVTARAEITEELRNTLRSSVRRLAERTSTSGPGTGAGAPPPADSATEATVERRYLQGIPWEQADRGQSANATGKSLSCDGDTCDVGLVGMHIATKPATQFLWSWSTFAHRDNLAGGDSLFSTSDCARLGPDKAETRCDPESGRCVTQVCSETRPTPDTAALNEQIRSMFLNHPESRQLARLANYELLGTQWIEVVSSPFGAPPAPGGAATAQPARNLAELQGKAHPARLTNPVFETFKPNDSCFDCHRNARVKLDEHTAKRTDMLFFLTHPSGRQPVPSPAGGK